MRFLSVLWCVCCAYILMMMILAHNCQCESHHDSCEEDVYLMAGITSLNVTTMTKKKKQEKTMKIIRILKFCVVRSERIWITVTIFVTVILHDFSLRYFSKMICHSLSSLCCEDLNSFITACKSAFRRHTTFRRSWVEMINFISSFEHTLISLNAVISMSAQIWHLSSEMSWLFRSTF